MWRYEKPVEQGYDALTMLYILQNLFWSLRDSDPYKALSFDRLHTNHLGLFKHLWDEVKRIAKEMGRSAQAQVDGQ